MTIMIGPAPAEVEASMHTLGNYRVKRAQTVANLGGPDGISGALLLGLGMRETDCKNVEGGAMLDANGHWVAETRPEHQDVGWMQISRFYQHDALAAMPGVPVKEWGPPIAGKNPTMAGFVPRFEDSLQFSLKELHENQAFAEDHEVPADDRVRFAVAAHNAGAGGALKGYHEGDVDKYTAGGDYSAWVFQARSQIVHWLLAHPNWYIAA